MERERKRERGKRVGREKDERERERKVAAGAWLEEGVGKKESEGEIIEELGKDIERFVFPITFFPSNYGQ